jgi:type I restriction enzyme S subunit
MIDCPHSTPVYSDEKTGYYCVRSGDIVDGYLDLSKTLHVGWEIYEERIKRYTPQIDDIVYSREGGRLGNAARILGGESICLGQRIMLFKAGEDNSPDFLWALLESRSFKAKLQGLVGGGAAPRVNIKDLKKITVINPPNDIQTQFSRVAKRIDQIKSRYQQSLTDLESLYGALSQKAFKGELDLSHISVPDKNIENDRTTHDLVVVNKEDEFMPAFILKNIPLSDPPSRQDFIRFAFSGFLEELSKGEELELDHFWRPLALRATDLTGLDDYMPFSTYDYDTVKYLLFDAISKGELEQILNQIEADGDSTSGNKIILRKSQ